MPGIKFPTRIVVIFSMLNPIAIMSKPPTEVICSIVSGTRKFFMKTAVRVISPWYINTAIPENITPSPMVEEKMMEVTPSSTDLAKSV